MEIINKDPNKLSFADYNPREITANDFEALKKSLQEFGFVEPVVVNKNDEIIGGHMRVRAARDLGMKEVPCVYVDLKADKAKLLNLALNRISGRWDTGKLEEMISGMKLEGIDLKLSGFENWEVDFYNQGGEDKPEFPDIQGEQPGEATLLIFTFKDEEDARRCAEHINDGKFIKTIDGAKLLKLVSG